METFTFRYKNITRELPVYEVSAGVRIAYLDTLSDYELVTALSHDMAALIRANEAFRKAERVVLFTAENKGVPFAYAIARELSETGGKTVGLAIARKQEKKFYGNCIYAEKTSITTEREKDRLLVPESDREKLKNAAAVLIDDFYSTGSSMNALKMLAKECGAEVLDKVVAVWEVVDGNAEPDVKYVATLPVLK